MPSSGPFVSLRVGLASPMTRRLWQQAFRTVTHDRRELRRILRTMEQVPAYSPGGLYLGRVTVAAFEQGPHDRVIERIARGLYFHHFGERVSGPVEVFCVNERHPGWGGVLRQTLSFMTKGTIGGSAVFEYAFARAPDAPQSSLWLFRFYAGHTVLAATGRIARTAALMG